VRKEKEALEQRHVQARHGGELGFPLAATRRILEHVVTRVLADFQQEKAAVEQRHAALADEVGIYLGNEVRLMNVMEKIVLPEMLGRLGK
jgi:hypothetical protein